MIGTNASRKPLDKTFLSQNGQFSAQTLFALSIHYKTEISMIISSLSRKHHKKNKKNSDDALG